MATLNIKQLNTTQTDFWQQLETLLAWEGVSDDKVVAVVKDVIARIRKEGDAALVEFTNKFDRTSATSMHDLVIDEARLDAAIKNIAPEKLTALKQAAQRVRDYHERQKSQSWSYKDADGTLLGQQVTALDRVGIYVPGGTAPLPSSLLLA